MREVNVGHKSLADYRSIVPRELMTEIDELAEGLRGRKVLHVNATAFGGGVAEILYTLVPLITDAGLEAEWQIITAPPEFFNVTKSFHNGLQGHSVDFGPEARELYEGVCRANAEQLSRHYDFIVIHDPQPLAMRDFVTAAGDGARWIWRCHIDTSTPDRASTTTCCRPSTAYDAAVYTLRDYVPQGLTVPVREIAPTIDPLAPKNMQLSRRGRRLHRAPVRHRRGPAAAAAGVALRPLEGPAGGRRRVPHRQGEHPDVQLALIGSMASDDPEGWEYLEKVIDYAGDDPDVFILSNLDNVGSVEINAFQSHADVVMQKSTREGFGLTVTEALWKGAPDHRRRRGRHPAADRGRRHRLPRGLGRRVRGALPADPRRSGEAPPHGAARQGARAPRVPHAAAAARRPAPLPRPARG